MWQAPEALRRLPQRLTHEVMVALQVYDGVVHVVKANNPEHDLRADRFRALSEGSFDEK